MRVFEDEPELQAEPGPWQLVGQRFAFKDASLLLPSLKLSWHKVKRFKVTMVITTSDLIDIWYLNASGVEELASFRREPEPTGYVYDSPEHL